MYEDAKPFRGLKTTNKNLSSILMGTCSQWSDAKTSLLWFCFLVSVTILAAELCTSYSWFVGGSPVSNALQLHQNIRHALAVCVTVSSLSRTFTSV